MWNLTMQMRPPFCTEILCISIWVLLLSTGALFLTDKCNPNPCPNGVPCVAGPTAGTYKCLDACQPNPCMNGATCTNAAGSYQCACQFGFTGTQCDKKGKLTLWLTYSLSFPLHHAVQSKKDKNINAILWLLPKLFLFHVLDISIRFPVQKSNVCL